MTSRPPSQVGRVLLLPSTRKDGAVTQGVLLDAGIACRVCDDLRTLLREVGPEAGAAVIPEEELAGGGMDELAAVLEQQPPWSDLPILVLSRSGVDSAVVQRAIDTLGNVILLERPMRVAAFVSAIQSALRARRRQQEIRRHLIELKAAEESLRESDRRKDEFLAMLSHELRNPLAPIRNALHVLRLADSDEGRRRLYALVDRQVHHMVRLVDDLLEVARIRRGSMVLRKELLDVRDVVRHAIETSRPSIEERRHRLEVELPQAPLVLEGDPVRLAQVFANLLNNAARYTPPGGRIRIEVSPDARAAVVSVSDDGAGLAPEMLPRIFELFAQGGPGPQPAGGLGVGLALARRLVEMHQGAIEARSEGPGRGSRFTVRLPLAEGREDELRPGPDARATKLGRALRVLVVDDNHDAADSLGALLALLGAETSVVHDGRSALELLERWSPGVVLLDLGMPGMDGYEVARRIRSDPRHRDVRLVALTGWGQEADRRRSKAAGFDQHLVKPADLDALRELLDAPEGRASRRRPEVETGR